MSNARAVCVHALVQLAFLMEHTELQDDAAHMLDSKTKQLKSQLRGEVPGFEHHMADTA